MKISADPFILDAPDLFGNDKELYMRLKEQGAGKDALLRVERAMKHPPKPISQSLAIPVAKRKPVKSLEDRLWARYRCSNIDPVKKGKLVFNGELIEVPLQMLLVFVALIEEPGRFHAESRAIINWQITVLTLMVNGNLDLPIFDEPDEKAASQHISKFFKGVSKLANAEVDP